MGPSIIDSNKVLTFFFNAINKKNRLELSLSHLPREPGRNPRKWRIQLPSTGWRSSSSASGPSPTTSPMLSSLHFPVPPAPLPPVRLPPFVAPSSSTASPPTSAGPVSPLARSASSNYSLTTLAPTLLPLTPTSQWPLTSSPQLPTFPPPFHLSFYVALVAF